MARRAGNVLPGRARVRLRSLLVDIRDCAILLTAFASGARRRSEVGNLRVEDLVEEEPVRAEPDNLASPPLPLAIRLGRTKTTCPGDDARSLMIGRSVEALTRWLHEARIDSGPVFRRIHQWGNVDRALAPQSINLVLKARCEGRARSRKFLRARPALRLDQSRQSRRAADRSDAAVAAQVTDPGRLLLQQSGAPTRQGGSLDYLGQAR